MVNFCGSICLDDLASVYNPIPDEVLNAADQVLLRLVFTQTRIHHTNFVLQKSHGMSSGRVQRAGFNDEPYLL